MALLNYLETGSTDSAWNLAFEEYVLTTKREGDWLILWQNANTVVVGMNQNAEEEISRSFVEARGITVVRRTTGGGAVYHDLGNLNYSFITDAGDAQQLSITRFTRPVCAALESLGVSAVPSGRNDITINGKKVSGTAQRLHKGRILHHGTLLFDSDAEMVAGALNADPEKFRSKAAKSVRSRIGNIREMLPEDMDIAAFKARLLLALAGDGLQRRNLDPAELSEIGKLADEKYRSWDWNFGASPAFSIICKRRLEGGALEVGLQAASGIIEYVRFRGDFMAVEDCSPVAEALQNVRFARNDVMAVLDGFNLTPMFGAVTAPDIADTIFGTPDSSRKHPACGR
ncbi:MAG TPA: lipoate--protein ligase [Clostridiales bacterium]|nr:lipoate--protein ligase [Clostridiales bacterium]